MTTAGMSSLVAEALWSVGPALISSCVANVPFLSFLTELS